MGAAYRGPGVSPPHNTASAYVSLWAGGSGESGSRLLAGWDDHDIDLEHAVLRAGQLGSGFVQESSQLRTEPGFATPCDQLAAQDGTGLSDPSVADEEVVDRVGRDPAVDRLDLG